MKLSSQNLFILEAAHAVQARVPTCSPRSASISAVALSIAGAKDVLKTIVQMHDIDPYLGNASLLV